MKKFILLYKGLATRPGASHEQWPVWFNKTSTKLVEAGSPMAHGRTLHSDGTVAAATTSLNGYSIVQAKNMDEALSLTKDHPYLAAGNKYSIELYELPA